MAKNRLNRYSGVREFQQALAKAAEGTTLPVSVAPTLLPPKAAIEARVLEPPARTAILSEPTTLGSAASAISTEQIAERQIRRWPWAAGAGVFIAGIVLALLWPHAGTAPRQPPVAIAPVAPVEPIAATAPAAPPVDAGTPLPISVDAAPKVRVPATVPASAKPKSRSTGKKTGRIRMEDL
jgi:hypothetical protein